MKRRISHGQAMRSILGCSRVTHLVGDADSLPGREYKPCVAIGSLFPSMRNPLDKASAAQSLDGDRLTGSLHFPKP